MQDALRLLRIPFSLFLMPVFWFAISHADAAPNWGRTIATFVLIHLFLYPASNGYNSYFDRDEGSIGGLKHPPKVNESLFWLVVLFDFIAIGGACLLSFRFGGMMLAYTLISKAYSWDKIRLKRFPIISTVVVTGFQGAFTFYMVLEGAGIWPESHVFMLQYAAISTILLAGSYPLTQVYQHGEDARRGDRTLSLVLGFRGTFVFAGLMLLFGAGWLLGLYALYGQWLRVAAFAVCTGPVLGLFALWARDVWRDPATATFERTMRMNQVSSLCLSAAFIMIFILSFL